MRAKREALQTDRLPNASASATASAASAAATATATATAAAAAVLAAAAAAHHHDGMRRAACHLHSAARLQERHSSWERHRRTDTLGTEAALAVLVPAPCVHGAVRAHR